MRRTLISVLTAGLLAVGPALAAPPAMAAAPLPAPVPVGAGAPRDAEPGAEAAPPPVQWGSCASSSLREAGARCGFVTVPMDHDRPDGPTVRLAVSRVRHTVPDDRYQGVMLVNPGGPGGPGLGLSTLGGSVPDGAGAAYDWIGFDPRGVGASEPRLSCDPDYNGYHRPDYRPENGAVAAWLPRTTAYADACAARGGDLLRHDRTEDTVRDMDAIRAALGAPRISFYGFSYGTLLGQVYATMFPERVHRMVLDGVLDERDWSYAANLSQDVAFEYDVRAFYAWVARHDDVYHLGTTADAVAARVDAESAALRAAPAGGLVGPSEWTDIVLRAGYNVREWPATADALAAGAVRHDAAALKTAYDDAGSPADDNTYASYLATQCTDAPYPPDWATWARDATVTAARAPFETWGNVWYNAPCLSWPVPPGPRPVVDGTRLASGPLLIAETHDGATPFPGALHARNLFPGSALVEGVGGTTHSSSLSGVACTDDTVAAYLATGTLPARQPGERSDRRCPPLAPPDPTEPTAG